MKLSPSSSLLSPDLSPLASVPHDKSVLDSVSPSAVPPMAEMWIAINPLI